MQLAKKSALGLGLVVAMLASIIFTPGVRADQHNIMVDGKKLTIEVLVKEAVKEAAMETKKNPVTMIGIALLAFGLATVPYLINYSTRKPQKEPRFDRNKLLHGSFKEKIKHLHYFISDTVFGWPYKSNKMAFKEDGFGKIIPKIQNEQFSGGWLGNTHAWVLYGGGQALTFQTTILLYLSMWVAGIQWWMNPSLKAPNVEETQKMLSNIVLLRAATG